MSVTQYIGARYVPLFADPTEWSNERAYEPLTIVQHQGNSYTSKQAVPIGIEIENTQFWALTGNYNAQVEAYRQEVMQFADDIEEAQQTADEAKTAVNDEIAAREAAIAAEARAREEADETINSTLAIDSKTDATQLGAIVFGQIVFDACNGMPDHPGAICSIGTNQYIISSPLYEEYKGTGAGHFRTISIENNYDNAENVFSANYGHANSMCFSKELNSIVYAPLWHRSASTPPEQSLREWCDYVETLSNTGAIGRQIPLNKAGAQAAAVSYDEISGKTYAFSNYDANNLEIFAYDAESAQFEPTGALINFPYNLVTLRQDVAVRDGIFYACNTEGAMFIGSIETGEVYAERVIEKIPVAANGELFQEYDGLEFTENGELLQLVHSELKTSEGGYYYGKAVAAVIQVVLGDASSTLEQYADTRPAAPLHSCYVDAESLSLRSRGTQTAPYKSVFQAQISQANPRRIYVQSNYATDVEFIFKTTLLELVSNVTFECTNALRIGCSCSIKGDNNTNSIFKLNKIVYNQSVDRFSINNNVRLELPEDYDIASTMHGGQFLVYNSGVRTTNSLRYGTTPIEDGQRYLWANGFGQIH